MVAGNLAVSTYGSFGQGDGRCRWCRCPWLVAGTLHFLGTDGTLALPCLDAARNHDHD